MASCCLQWPPLLAVLTRVLLTCLPVIQRPEAAPGRQCVWVSAAAQQTGSSSCLLASAGQALVIVAMYGVIQQMEDLFPSLPIRSTNELKP